METKKLTAQEVFDRVAVHLLKQGRKSQRIIPEDPVTCFYRGPTGLKCAVGCLIADEDYSSQMEGNSVHALIADFEENPSVKTFADHDDLLSDLQILHDFGHVAYWTSGLCATAERFKLDPKVVEEFEKNKAREGPTGTPDA